MIQLYQSEFNTIAVCAFRYALGRSTYITAEMSEFLIKHKVSLLPNTKELIKKEIEIALERGAIGMACDREEWLKLVKELEND